MRARTGAVAFALAAALAVSSWQAGAYILFHTGGTSGEVIHWAGSNLPLRFAITNSVENSASGGEAGVRAGFATWSQSGAAIAFEELVDPALKAMTADAADLAEGSHLVAFDGTGASGLFGGSPTGTIAITRITYYVSSGRLVDADMVFNDRDFDFSTARTPGTIDVQNTATHEAGHFIGINHSGVIGATMFPFAQEREILRRSLERDDREAAIALYGPAQRREAGSIAGTVVDSGAAPLARAQVVILDQLGRVVAGGISAADGRFEIAGLAAGGYSIYANPFDGPVGAGNIDPTLSFDTAFSTTFLGGNSSPAGIAVTARRTSEVGDLVVDPASPGFDAQLSSPRVLQLPAGSSGTIQLGSRAGASIAGAVQASTLASGVSISGALGGATATLTIAIDQGAAPGLADLYLDDSAGRRTALVGVVEILPGPSIASVFPAAGSVAGGSVITLVGAGFRAPVQVELGGLAVSRQPALIDEHTLTFVSDAHASGSVEVAVINPDGGRFVVSGGYTFVGTSDPALTMATPDRGSAGGGDQVALGGSGFQSGARVFFGADPHSGTGGIESPAVSFVSAAHLDVETPPGPLGLSRVLVLNPDGTAALAPVFSYAQEVGSGTSFSGSIATAGEEDLFVLDALAGTQITLSLKAARGASLQPVITIEDGLDDSVLLSSDPADPAFDPAFVRLKRGAVQIRAWPVPATTTLDLIAGGLSATSGAYTLKLKAKIPKVHTRLKLPKSPPIALGSHPIQFEALAGSAFGAKFRASKRESLELVLDSFVGPAGALAVTPNITPGVSLSADGKALVFKGLILPDFGSYTLVLRAAAGTAGALSGAAKIKPPRAHLRLTEN